MVHTFEFEGAPGNVQMDTATFDEQGGMTVLHVNSVFLSVEARDAMYESGMDDGMNQSFEWLDDLLPKLAANN